MVDTFYDQNGNAIAYLDQETNAIYLYSGFPIAWLSDQSIFSYQGKHLGWLIEGWVIDHNGNSLYFTENSKGGPSRPARNARPARGAREARPARAARESTPARSARTVNWSKLNAQSFFLID